MNKMLTKLVSDAVSRVTSLQSGTRVRVISHYDADGITAAAVLCQALYRQGYEFHASLMRNPFTKGLERILKEKNDLVLFSDMGSGQLDFIEQFNCPCILFDHHQVVKEETKDHVLQINANLFGWNGNYEASGATMSYLFAEALNPDNQTLLPLALTGAIGDKQHIGGLKGLNKQLLEKALQQDLLQPQQGMKLAEETVADSLFYSIDPYYKGVSGQQKSISETLKQLNIPHDASCKDLSSEQKTQLQSYLMLILVKAGVSPLILDIANRTRYYAVSLGCELERFADLLDACGKFGHRGLGLSLCLQEKKDWTQALQVEHDYKDKVLQALYTMEQDGVKELAALRFFHSDNSSLGGVIGGIAMNYLLDEKKPLLSLARKDHEIHISGRGNQQLVQQGLDLGKALQSVAKNMNGFGGGHMIAAGATIPEDKEQSFLTQVDILLAEQLKVNT